MRTSQISPRSTRSIYVCGALSTTSLSDWYEKFRCSGSSFSSRARLCAAATAAHALRLTLASDAPTPASASSTLGATLHEARQQHLPSHTGQQKKALTHQRPTRTKVAG